jgi:hypothetical protein
VSLGLNYIEDAVEVIARKVLGSDEAGEVAALIDRIRAEEGHEPPVVAAIGDGVLPGTKDQQIADQKVALADAQARIDQLEREAAAADGPDEDEAPAKPPTKRAAAK